MAEPVGVPEPLAEAVQLAVPELLPETEALAPALREDPLLPVPEGLPVPEAEGVAAAVPEAVTVVEGVEEKEAEVEGVGHALPELLAVELPLSPLLREPVDEAVKLVLWLTELRAVTEPLGVGDGEGVAVAVGEGVTGAVLLGDSVVEEDRLEARAELVVEALAPLLRLAVAELLPVLL